MKRLRPLTEKKHAAIKAYARENGRSWKSRLRDDWMNARSTGILQALRNRDRFHGTEAEFRAHIKRLISGGLPAKIAR
jgi:hypothetical protein